MSTGSPALPENQLHPLHPLQNPLPNFLRLLLKIMLIH